MYFIAIDSRCIYGLYDSVSNVTIISHGLAKALGLTGFTHLAKQFGRQLAT